MENKIDNLMKAHLNVNWLRPESALFDAIASSKIAQYEICSPSLDLGCGNGMFSFITAGGNFSIDYDWYLNVDTEGFWENKDIYDSCKVNNLETRIISKPAYRFTYGLDHKPNLLKQAGLLGFYENLIEHDANLRISFDSDQFKTVFSNILYWLDDPEKSLKEIHRILDKDGTALLSVPNTKFREYCFTYQWKEQHSELLRLLNRGRAGDVHFTFSYNDFRDLAGRAGFSVLAHSYFLSPLTSKIWDIGLRPLSPLLIKMCNELNINSRRAIKAEWMETIVKFLGPLFEMENTSKEEGGFHLFVLRK